MGFPRGLSRTVKHRLAALAVAVATGPLFSVSGETRGERENGPAGVDPRAELVRVLDTEGWPFSQASELVAQWSERYPEQALRWTLALPVPQSDRLAAVVVRTVAAGDLRLAERLVRSIHGEPPIEVTAALVYAIARTDGPAAERWLREHPHPVAIERSRLYQGLYMYWSALDVRGAMAHVATIAQAADRYHAILGVMPLAIETDVCAADELFANLPPELQSGRVASILHARLRDVDPRRAAAYRHQAERRALNATQGSSNEKSTSRRLHRPNCTRVAGLGPDDPLSRQ